MYRLGGGHLGDPLFLQRRASVEDKYCQLRQTHAALPADLHDFQADIVGAAIDQQDHSHILACLPTGMGKTLPMLITGCLLPPGSTTILVVPLTSIKHQLLDDCSKMGISVLDGDQVRQADLERELVNHPTVLLASPEFLASTEVRDVLMNCQLTPHGCKPVVAIDECQVLDEVFGWGGFRSSYGNETWTWLTAALDPKILMSSASLGEDSLKRVCATLGICRDEVKTFYMHPLRNNIYQQTRYVRDFSTRFRDESFGFLLPLAASGHKVQVYCPTMDLMDRASRWAKGAFKRAGLGDQPVWKLSGNVPSDWKATVMERFRLSASGILFATDVAAMGLNVPRLCIGVSLGMPTTRWKWVQLTGRLARRSDEQGIFINVIPEKQRIRVSALEREEYNAVKTALSSGSCLNRGAYDSFQIIDAHVTYEGTDEREKCDRCWCCTRCSSDCSKACEGRVEEESEDEAVVRILGLETETVAGAEAVRRQLVIESEILYADDDTESDDPENEYSEEEI